MTPTEQVAQQVSTIAGPSFHAKGETLLVEVESGEAAEVMGRARARHGGCPLGYVAGSEADALEALSNGADEALVLHSLDAQAILSFVDRTVLRASIRGEQERMRAAYAQSEKLAALGTVVAGVAHEINNPLAAVLLSVEAIRTMLHPLLDASDEILRLESLGRPITVDEVSDLKATARSSASAIEGKTILEEMSTAVQTIADVVRDLRIFARTDEDEAPEVIDVTHLVEQVLRIVGREITTRAQVERDYAANLPPLVVPRTRLAQVITNILINAAHAIREIARPVHRLRITLRADDEAFAISISDTGPGIPAESLDRIFDPFYTTKRENMGTGLGLSISRSILRRLGGDLIVESVHGDGATFVAIVPLPERDALRKATIRGSGFVPNSSRTPRRRAVLVVDDDERLLRAYARVLREDYDVLLASDGQEAIDLLNSGSTPDVILTDLLMQEVDGRALHGWLRESRPALAARTIFVTAATNAPAYAEFLSKLDNPVLEKPASRLQILQAIDGLLEPGRPDS